MAFVILGVGEHSSQQNRGQRRGRIGGQVGEDRPEVENQVETDPEDRPGRGSELAREDRFAGVEGVAGHLHVVDHLAHDTQRGQPHQGAAVLGGDRRTHQPFPATDRGASQKQSRSQQSKPVPPGEDGGFHQLTGVPGRHLAGTRARSLKPAGAFGRIDGLAGVGGGSIGSRGRVLRLGRV